MVSGMPLPEAGDFGSRWEQNAEKGGGIKQKAVLSKMLERTAQNRVIFGEGAKRKNPDPHMVTGFFDEKC